MPVVKGIWIWLPVLIFKIFVYVFRILWQFNLWILQKISGMPLYCCRPEYRAPGILLGTLRVISILNFLLFPFIVASEHTGNQMYQSGSPADYLLVLGVGIAGLGLLAACRLTPLQIENILLSKSLEIR